MKKIQLIFILVLINSITSYAQFSQNVLHSINPLEGIQYNEKILLKNGFKLNKLLSNSSYNIYEKNQKN